MAMKAKIVEFWLTGNALAKKMRMLSGDLEACLSIGSLKMGLGGS